jgi:hypothetical protein
MINMSTHRVEKKSDSMVSKVNRYDCRDANIFHPVLVSHRTCAGLSKESRLSQKVPFKLGTYNPWEAEIRRIMIGASPGE